MASLPLLNFNPRANIAWKGNVLHQITSTLQKNGVVDGKIGKGNQFRTMPLKIYRRELATSVSNQHGCPNSRISSSIDEFSRPGGYVISEASENAGLVNTIETPQPSSLNETYGCGPGSSNSYNCAENNAKRRCRSSGIIKRTYDPARQDLAYFTNTNQYLVSRSKTFLQNQYRHVRSADTSIVSNPLASKDTYSPNGISHCPKARVIAGANAFSYYWIDASGVGSTEYTVEITPGYYDVHDLNAAFEVVMKRRGHYLVYAPTNSSTFLMRIVYNNANGAVEIQSYSTAIFYGNTSYRIPVNQLWVLPATATVPVYKIPSTGIQGVLGFAAGYYPALNAGALQNTRDSSVGFLSNTQHTLYPSYSVMYYKPSNNRFGAQGGVSSSDMTQRLKYETITNNAAVFAKNYGSQVGNAMAYGVPDQPYTIKDKIGFPLTKTPVIDKYTGEIRCRTSGRLVGRCLSTTN